MKPQNSSSSSKQLLIGLGALVVALAAAALFFLTDRGGSPPPASQEGRPAQLAQQQPAAPGAATTGAPQSQPQPTTAVVAAASPAAASAGSASNLTAQNPAPAAPAPSGQKPSDNPQFPAVRGDAPFSGRAVARVQVNGKSFDLEPNQLGHLPRVHVEPNAEIPVTMAFDKGEEGEAVSVQVEDGGQLDTKTLAEVAKLDGDHRIAFKYRVTDQRGLFRVVVRKGTEVKTFNFWVGAPLEVAAIPAGTPPQ